MPYSPRSTRLVKSYAPIDNALTRMLDLHRVENRPLKIFCKETKQFLNSDEFYVDEYLQEVDPRTLHVNNFRHVCKEVWDQKVKNYRNGLGWKSDQQLEDVSNTLENFFEGNE